MHRVEVVAGELRAGRIGHIGPQLDDSHRSLRNDFAVSCPELGVAVESANAAGSLGTRMTGGGFGGSAIALVPAATASAVAAAVDEAFARAGLRKPAFLLATAASPADRVA